jgi:hypothetical protein
MKFSHLPMGARFRYQGRLYSKTSPLAATGEDGLQRLIPRSAAVEAAEVATPAPGQDLAGALTSHHEMCRALLAEAAERGPGALAALTARLDEAHARLVEAVL